MENIPTLPVLTAEEQRVLGALMEKARTTPEYYPLTLNALVAACNQKTSRKPVVSYDEHTVISALDTLKRKGLVSTATGGSSRVTKYKHNFAIVYPLVPAEVSIICLLLLRGFLTPGEINTNAGRLYEFESLEEVQELLDKLASGEVPYVLQLPKRPGQKEARYAHLLGGTDIVDDEPASGAYATGPGQGSLLEERLAKVERELAELREAFDNLMKELS